ncbi:MAG: hypothetical protein EBU90_02475 [Proteobacteria bacterium]|nr:hypothetical protein [Pseudomonadota bacterium]NBP13101.1 hypothetical protein [bacterium]
MQLKDYCSAPYSLQFIKYLNYVRVFNSEPFLYKNRKLDILYTPCCGFKSVYLNNKYTFKKIILYDISPAQIQFYTFLIENWNGKKKISSIIKEFKAKFKNSIFKTDITETPLTFYDKKFDEMIHIYYKSKGEFLRAWVKFLRTKKEIMALDITKDYNRINSVGKGYYSLSNIFDFDVASCFYTPKQRREKFKQCILHLTKNKNSLFEFKFEDNNGIFTAKEIFDIYNRI